MRKRFLKIFVAVMLVFLSLANTSCSSGKKQNNEKYSIVCTAFPQYDFIKEITKGKEDKFDITYLFDNGADVHSFETDIGFNVKIKIMESDMFVYNGGESDSWVKNIIEDNSMNKDCKIVSLIDLVQKDLLIKTSHDDDHHHDESLSDKSKIETVDEHVWLSITNSVDICEKLYNTIIELDESNKETYKKNFESYRDKLLQLHSDAINMFAPYDARYVIVADRFPFVYFFRDYRIKYNAAFSGCSADTDATYENIIKLCEDIKNNNINSILVLEKSTTNISSSIISSVDRELKIYTLNSLQSVSRDDINNGVTYYDAMKKNIEALKNALS